jgi:hypothetical protein
MWKARAVNPVDLIVYSATHATVDGIWLLPLILGLLGLVSARFLPLGLLIVLPLTLLFTFQHLQAVHHPIAGPQVRTALGPAVWHYHATAAWMLGLPLIGFWWRRTGAGADRIGIAVLAIGVMAALGVAVVLPSSWVIG